jgi:hypothetical protein
MDTQMENDLLLIDANVAAIERLAGLLAESHTSRAIRAAYARDRKAAHTYYAAFRAYPDYAPAKANAEEVLAEVLMSVRNGVKHVAGLVADEEAARLHGLRERERQAADE